MLTLVVVIPTFILKERISTLVWMLVDIIM
jgi:hypothetical protein